MTHLTLPARPLVHVGYHKTATTWFQQHVWPSATSHDWVARATVQAAFLAPPGLHFDPDTSAEILELAHRTRPVVLSEENLSGYIHNGGLHGLIGPGVRVGTLRVRSPDRALRRAVRTRERPCLSL